MASFWVDVELVLRRGAVNTAQLCKLFSEKVLIGLQNVYQPLPDRRAKITPHRDGQIL